MSPVGKVPSLDIRSWPTQMSPMRPSNPYCSFGHILLFQRRGADIDEVGHYERESEVNTKDFSERLEYSSTGFIESTLDKREQ